MNQQKEFFDERALQWDSMCQHNPEKIERIMSLVQIKGHERILDVGTGTGVLIPFYEKLLSSGTVLAFDCSEKMIEVARNKFPSEKHPRIEFRVEDLYDAGYSEEFDVAVCYSCFPHFHDKQKAIAQLARALKNGGGLVIAHSDSREKINGVHMEAGEAVSEDKLPHISQLREMMINEGLKPVFQQDDEDYYMMVAKKLIQ